MANLVKNLDLFKTEQEEEQELKSNPSNISVDLTEIKASSQDVVSTNIGNLIEEALAKKTETPFGVSVRFTNGKVIQS